MLQRRADLIPNLVETVKGFAAHEETVFGDIAKARSALMNAQTPQDKIAANGQLDSALSRLLVIVENYPQLKSNENFLRLQDELAGHGKSHRRGAQTLQRFRSDLQHLHWPVPEQYLRKLGRLQTQRRILPGIADFARSSQSGVSRCQAIAQKLKRFSEFLYFEKQSKSNLQNCYDVLACVGGLCRVGAPARLRSDGSQSFGGNAMRQNFGEGSENSKATSDLPSLVSP